ncbi:hypothetical protein [Psittacicella gerlachiana]|uniref:Porin n=1 Tax=Psittacicella gerlachiana TaxID=2028574 RepID=A0A3A1Y469_9GAMM|nr:hypothetical protein [Psittacicella gerlachiana]RIY32018.1 hypothetical protein CKF59_07225 [Psittacicella gerlachiana]
MKKTLVALTLAALASSAFAQTTVYQTPNGKVYVDGSLRYHHTLQGGKVETKAADASAYSFTSRNRNDNTDNLRLRFGLGFDTKLTDTSTLGAYLRYQKNFTSRKYTYETSSASEKRKSHNSDPFYLTKARLSYAYKDTFFATFGVRGEDDAAEYYQFSDAVKLTPGAKTAFDLVNRVDVADGSDKRTARVAFVFGENREHLVSVSYADSKVAASTTYYNQYAAVYNYTGYTDLTLQVVASAGHYNGAGSAASQNTHSLDFAVYYDVLPQTKVTATVGHSQLTVKGGTTTKNLALNLEVVNATNKYVQPALGYSYVSATSTRTGVNKETTKTNTVYARVYSEVFTYKSTNVLLGVEAAHRQVKAKDASSNHTKSNAHNFSVFAKYSY